MDGPVNGPAPLPWDIVLHAGQKFKTEQRKVEVPHTAYVKVNCPVILFAFELLILVRNASLQKVLGRCSSIVLRGLYLIFHPL